MKPIEEMTSRELAAAIAAAESRLRTRRTRAHRVQAVEKRVLALIAPAIDAHRAAEDEVRQLKVARLLRRGIPRGLAARRRSYVRWLCMAYFMETLPAWERKRAKRRMEHAQHGMQRACSHPFVIDHPPPDPRTLAAADVVKDGLRECAVCTMREERSYFKGSLSSQIREAPGRIFTVVSSEHFEGLAWHLRRFAEVAEIGLCIRSIAPVDPRDQTLRDVLDEIARKNPPPADQ